MSLEIKKRIEESVGNDWEFIALSLFVLEKSFELAKRSLIYLWKRFFSKPQEVEDGKDNNGNV